MSIYRETFGHGPAEGTFRSAKVVVPLLLELYRPTSAVDVGCGAGSWLAALVDHGIDDVVGVDGDYVPRESLRIPVDRFLPRDLSQPLDLGRTFDLAVCLEVAEHLDPAAADGFVAELCALAPVILFSAAVPHQGGLGHVNEQWPGYWVERFGANGFTAVDCLRSRLWDNSDIAWFYAQNSFLLVRDDVFADHPALAEARDRSRGMPLAVVHPKLYAARVRDAADLHRFPMRTLLEAVAFAARRSARYRLTHSPLRRHRSP